MPTAFPFVLETILKARQRGNLRIDVLALGNNSTAVSSAAKTAELSFKDGELSYKDGAAFVWTSDTAFRAAGLPALVLHVSP